METKIYNSPLGGFQVHTMFDDKDLLFYGEESIQRKIIERVVEAVAKKVIEEHSDELVKLVSKRLIQIAGLI